MKFTSSTFAGILVALIGGALVFQALGQVLTRSKVSQIEVRTDAKWPATLTAEERTKAAREAVVAWLKAASDDDLDGVVRLSGLPFWLDGGMADSEQMLRQLLTPSMGHAFTPVALEVLQDFRQVARAQLYPMDGMLIRASDGEKSIRISVQFGRSVLIVGADD